MVQIQNPKNMNNLKRSSRSVLLGLSLLVGLAANVSASFNFIGVGNYGGYPPAAYGTIYSVPASSSYEWEVQGDSHAMIGGAGLSVNAYGSSSYQGDYGTTAYADNISYGLTASGGGYAYLYVNW